jgi:urea carboxylase
MSEVHGGAATMTAPARYSFGGDEHLFVELSESMSLEAFFKSLLITQAIKQRALPGITEICPANASYQVRFDPDLVRPEVVLALAREIESATAVTDFELPTRIVEIPVLYGDPWTHETMMRFRERHQDPAATDLEYAARINGYASVSAFVDAHAGSPWFVSMVGFVAGLPFLFQMVERARQIETPKYLRPRTDTPKLTIGHGGCFGAIYSVRGAGGYQMFGVTPVPIFDPAQGLPHFSEFMCFFRPGDIVKYRAIDRAEYDRIAAEVADGCFELRCRNVAFSLGRFLADPAGCNRQLEDALYDR